MSHSNDQPDPDRVLPEFVCRAVPAPELVGELNRVFSIGANAGTVVLEEIRCTAVPASDDRPPKESES